MQDKLEMEGLEKWRVDWSAWLFASHETSQLSLQF